MTTVIETCQISPPAEVASEVLVPLAFFDINFLHIIPIRLLLFYEHPCSESSFLEALVPKLQQSLSLTLQHYLPVAGNLLYPLDTAKKPPVFRYATGDSVCLTIAKSSHDFGELIGNHARDADQFYDFLPPMPTIAGDDPEHRMASLAALQVTLFPGRGICLGLAFRHCLCDASSIQGFVSAWASMNKDGGDMEGLRLPTFDRSWIHDSYGVDAVYWENMRHVPLQAAPSFPIPTNRVRATFTLRPGDIDNLKAKINKPGASSFVVTTSYVWSCLAKPGGVDVEVGASQLLVFPADARRLVNPPVPANYFGNCLVDGLVILEQKKLVGDEGFIAAAQGISDAINKLVNVNKDEFLKSAKDWPSEFMQKYESTRAMTVVAWSPKFDLGVADFGWGKLRSQELLSMDEIKYTMFLSKSTDSDGSLEVGLSLPREKMEAFAAIFADGLRL